MLLAESGGSSGRRGGGGYGRRFKDEEGTEEVEEYDHDASEEEAEEDGDEVEDPEVRMLRLQNCFLMETAG